MGSKKRKRQAQEASDSAPPAKKSHKQSKATKPSPAVAPSSIKFVETPKGAELAYEALLYENLSSEDDTERLKAADAIVSGLLGGDGVSEQTLQRHLERRLFRGLASGRKGSRLGFSVVLTEILSQLLGEQKLSEQKYPQFGFDKLLETLVEKNTPKGDLSGQEERDHYFGQLFGLQCFVRAKVLFDNSEEASGRWKSIFRALVELANKKTWIREECGFVIIEALSQMSEKEVEWTLKHLHKEGLSLTPEGVGIWLTARRLHPTIDFPKGPWGKNKTPFDNLDLLATTLKQSSKAGNQETQTKQTGSWNPQPHFAWNIVLEDLLHQAFQEQESEVGKSSRGTNSSKKTEDSQVDGPTFAKFWKVLVDENLFSTSASPERKYWGYQVFQKILIDFKNHNDRDTKLLSTSGNEAMQYNQLLQHLFSRNLVKCLINHSAQEDRFLHRAAQKSLKTIQDVTKEQPSMAVEILPKLISGDGVYNFDQVTRSKTIDSMLAHVDGIYARDVILKLCDIFMVMAKDMDAKEAESQRQKCGDYILSMIRHASLFDDTKDHSWIKDTALPWLANAAYGSESSSFNWQPKLSEASRTMFRTRLASAITHVLSDSKACYYPCYVVRDIVPDAIAMDDGIAAARKKAHTTMTKLMETSRKEPQTAGRTNGKGSKDDNPAADALAILYALVLIQLYNGEPEAASILDELDMCYNKLIKKRGAADSGDVMQVLVEILLSFVSKSSNLLRKAAELVFTAFSIKLNKESLRLMTDILDSSENSKGQEDLFNVDNDEDDIDEEDDELDDDLDSDVEMVEIDGVNGDDEDDEEAEDEEESDDDDDVAENNEDDDEEFRKLDDALAKALGTHRADQDLEEESSSDSDSDMTDSEMMAMDAKLSEIFKQRLKTPNKKQEKKDAKETIINFKRRVLDLLEIYVKREPDSPLAFELLPALLQLMRTTGTKQLRDKANDVIKTFSKAIRDSKKRPDIYLEELEKLIDDELNAADEGDDGEKGETRDEGDDDDEDDSEKGDENEEDEEGDDEDEDEDAFPDAAYDSSGRLVRLHPAARGLDVPSSMLAVLKSIHAQALQEPSHQFATAASAACSLVLTHMFRFNKNRYADSDNEKDEEENEEEEDEEEGEEEERDLFSEVATLYRDSTVAWFEGGMRLQPVFFHDFLNWCAVQGQQQQQQQQISNKMS